MTAFAHKLVPLIMGQFALGSLSATAVTLVAGWDDGFTGSTGWAPNDLAPETSVNVVATTEHNPWGQWNFGDNGASTDGTYGNLSTSVASADTTLSGAGRNLSLNRSNGTITFTLTNDSAFDRVMEGFYFDGIARFTDSAEQWAISYGGSISGTGSNGTLVSAGSMSGASAANRDQAIALGGLTDNVWEAGTDAVFTLSFTGGSNASSGGGQELVLDNIGITATLVPEPSAAVLLALTGLTAFRRRR